MCPHQKALDKQLNSNRNKAFGRRSAMKFASMFVGIACISLWLPTSYVCGQYKDLLQRVPETANSLVLVNAKALFDSPIAKQNKWRDKREARFSSGMTSIPPNA